MLLCGLGCALRAVCRALPVVLRSDRRVLRVVGFLFCAVRRLFCGALCLRRAGLHDPKTDSGQSCKKER